MYLALYRKWRPKTFDDVIGQDHITKTLKNEIISNKTAHAYLFTGSRGTGKTTCSKILAMAVNCLDLKDGNPCMECDNCKSILQGTTLDVLEIDAASNNGVDDVRVLREEAVFLPAQCKYRVYIIDEAHMLTPNAFNALLKIMEEPPQHVKFILATTEVHKILATVLSRCQRFDFLRIKSEDIAKRLMYISENEDFNLEQDASNLIARLADGGMRDALSILDQCIAYSKQVDTQIVSKATGLVLRDYLFEIADEIEKKNPAMAIQCVNNLYEHSKDLQRFLNELIEHYRNLMIIKTSANTDNLIKCLPSELEKMKVQAENIPMVSIMRYLNVLQESLDKISKNFDKRLCVEMALVKLCSVDMDNNIDALLDRIERLETAIKNGVELMPQNVKAIPMLNDKNIKEISLNTPALSKEVIKQNELDVQNKTTKENTNSFNNNIDLNKQTKETSKQNHSDDSLKLTPLSEWPEIIKMLTTTDKMVAMVLQNTNAFVGGDSLFITSDSELFSAIIKKDNFTKKLKEAIYQKTAKNYKLKIKKTRAKKDEMSSVLDELLLDAQNMGIEIDEK